MIKVLNCRFVFATAGIKKINDNINFKKNFICHTSLLNIHHGQLQYQGYFALQFLHRFQQNFFSLERLSAYYDSLESKYNVPYLIPSRVLLESARQNIGQSDKTTALELLAENETLYGVSPMSQALLVKANAIEKGPDERVKNALSHASPTDEEVIPFLGKWAGVVKVPDGTDTPIDWEIRNVAGKYVMESNVMKQFKTQSDFLFVNEKRDLVWGRKHDGGGIYISIGKLANDGLILTGTEDLIGFEFPPGMPPFKRNTFRFQKL